MARSGRSIATRTSCAAATSGPRPAAVSKSSTPSAAGSRSLPVWDCRGACGRAANRRGFLMSSATRISRARRLPHAKAFMRPSAFPWCCTAKSSASWSSSASKSARRTTSCSRCCRASAIRSGCFTDAGARRTISIDSSRSRSTCCALSASTAISNGSIPRGSACSATPRQELLARPFVEFIHPDDRQASTHEASKTLDRGGAAALRESLPAQGRDHPLAVVDGDAVP